MNKTLLSPNHSLIRIVFIFILCAVSGLVPVQMAQADAAPLPDPTVGGVGPYQPQKTSVQMMSETVFIDVPASPSSLTEPKQIRVNASFTMRNQGQTEETMQVIFPLTRLNIGTTEQALYSIDISSFVVKVAGQAAPLTTIETPPEVTAYDAEHGFAPEVQRAAFEVTFPVQKDVLLEVEYKMLNPYGEYGEGFTGIAYILETGAGWYGNIGSADITLRLPYQVTEEVVRYANPGYVISGNEMHWTLKNFEPTREDNLEVRVIHVDTWQAILDLRASVEQNPEDADAWADLADWYQQFSIFSPYGTGELYYSLNHHFADLTLEARQKVVALRPEWGNAHFRLAQILLFTNPTVEERFSSSGTIKDSIQPGDPSIQEVLHELDLALSYGFNGNVDIGDVEQFQQLINRAVPGLELTPPGTATETIAPPTETLLPTATDAPSPTASPTLIPTASPTPIPTETPSSIPYGVWISTAFILAIILGIFFYRLKSKS